METLKLWSLGTIIVLPGVFNKDRSPHSTMYCNFCFTLSPEVILQFFKLLQSKTDLSVYLAACSFMTTKSVLGGYLMDYGNVVHALES